MKFTKQSQALISFFGNNKCIKYEDPTKKTEKILTGLYDDILEAHNYIDDLKKRADTVSSGTGGFYHLKLNKTLTVSQIPKPNIFTNDGFPKEVRDHIHDHVNYHLSYSFSLFGRTIHFEFMVEDSDPERHIETYNSYVDAMLTWMHILNQYASSSCSKEITVYLYFTSLLKKLPETNVHVLGANHVNTAFTTTCPKVSEIVVFRKEEWFKVFMHETFHNFALDFSDMNTEECHAIIRKLFPVKSEVNLFESYCEFWAEIMNVCFCSFFHLGKDGKPHKGKGKYAADSIDEFLSNCDLLIHFERNYSFFQMVKTLDFMGLKYNHLHTNTPQSIVLRDNLYKEDSNVLAYYIIKTILLNNYQGFLNWCDTNNTSLLQFKKTTKNQKDFCLFIENNYKTPSMLESVGCTEKFLKKSQAHNSLKKEHSSVNKDVHGEMLNFLLKNMRMSVCELG